jgi:hypothetical protein
MFHGEPGPERVQAAVERPRGDGGLEAGAPGGVGIEVGRHVDAAGARRVDQGTGDAHQRAPPRLEGRLEVVDLHPGSAPLTDLDRLGHRLGQLLALAPDVAGVEAAVAGRHPGELHQLVGGREAARRVDQGGRHAEDAGPHGGVDHRPHAVQLRRPGAPVLHSDHGAAGLRGAVVGTEVHADARALETREPFGHGRRRHRRAALARQGGGDAHPHLVAGQPVAGEHAGGLVHHVDPSRRDVPARGIDLACAALRHDAQPHDAAVPDRHVGAHPRIAAPVQHPSVADDEVVRRRLAGEGRGQQAKEAQGSEAPAGPGAGSVKPLHRSDLRQEDPGRRAARVSHAPRSGGPGRGGPPSRSRSARGQPGGPGRWRGPRGPRPRRART